MYKGCVQQGYGKEDRRPVCIFSATGFVAFVFKCCFHAPAHNSFKHKIDVPTGTWYLFMSNAVHITTLVAGQYVNRY